MYVCIYNRAQTDLNFQGLNVHQLKFMNLLNYKKIMTAHTSDEQHPSGELTIVLHSQVPKMIKATQSLLHQR